MDLGAQTSVTSSSAKRANCSGPVAMAAIEWRNVVKSIRAEAESLECKEYLEVRYEDFINSPRETVGKIYEFCGLPHSSRVTKQLSMYKEFTNMNEKYSSRPKEDIVVMNMIMEALLKNLGYTNSS